MKLYTSIGPNPNTVRLFAAEKGMVIPFEKIDLRGGENRQPPYLAKNPMGQIPALELDDGTVLTEITAICEYLEELQPDPPLIGSTAEERAQTRMWVRRIDLNILEPMTQGFRGAEGLAMFRDRVRCVPQAAEDFKAIGREWLAWLDGQIAERRFIVPDRYTLADIILYAFLTFGDAVGQPLAAENANLLAWRERIRTRPAMAR